MIKKTIITSLIVFSYIISIAQDTINVKFALDNEYIGNELFIYQDSTKSKNFNKIKNNPSLFKKNDRKVPNLGITDYNNWIKFTLHNDSDFKNIFLNIPNPIIDKITVFLEYQNKTDSITYTNYFPLTSRTYAHQFYLYNLDLEPGETVTCYLKLNSGQQILAPINISLEKNIVGALNISDIRTGFYIGIMLVMLLYNLFIFFSIKDKDYLVYCHYMFWVLLTQATLLGFSHRFLWSNSVWLSQNMVIICGAMSGIATIIFSKSFLRTKQHTPRLHKLLNLAIFSYSVSIILLLLGFKSAAFQLVNICAGIGSLLVIIVALVIYRMKYAPAKFFLLSWSIFFTSVLIFISKDYNLLPYNQFTAHAVEIGSALEAIFLSFALAGKINILKKEKEASQAESLIIAKENERIIREQNVILEQKVQERTQEILETNEELNITLEDLKQTQTQLVASEKMASLGQLTAGIAHEINNPINFVTSNVSPLQRDVDMLLVAIETIESVGLSDKSKEEKQREIEDYKEDLDFDYLKIEINHLLSGIKEGATRTAEIVKGLRIFSRVDEDDLKKASLNEGLDSTLVIMNSLLNQHHISIVKDYGEIPLIECYPGKLNQVFLNIISNSIHAINKQHNEDGNGKLTIRTRSEEGSVFVIIKDNGIGMDEQTKGKIFDPFFTTKDVGEGTGLGMSITYNTIKKHNGEIFVNTALGAGAEIIIKLPVYHENDVS